MPTSAIAQLGAAQRWANGIAPAQLPPRPSVETARGDRLRVGFVSSDFRPHPMVYLSIAYWEGFDRDRFETFAYGIRAADVGPIGQRVARGAVHLRRTAK